MFGYEKKIAGLERIIATLRKDLSELREEYEERFRAQQRLIDDLQESYVKNYGKPPESEKGELVSPGFRTFSQRRAAFERSHAKDGMNPTGRQILKNSEAMKKDS